MIKNKVKFIFIAIVIVIGSFIFNLLIFNFHISSISYKGNTSSNNQNAGLILQDDRYIYYSDISNHWMLNVYDKMKTDIVSTSRSGVLNLNDVGDSIYFIMKRPGFIYKMNKDMEDAHPITFNKYFNCIVTDKYIFALASKEGEGNFLYRISLSGKTRKLIIQNLESDYDIYNDRVYFSNGEDNFKLYSCDFNGKNLEKIVDVKDVYQIVIYNNNIYYLAEKSIYKCDLDGNNSTCIYSGDLPGTMNVSDIGIVFKDKGTYFMGHDGENLTVISQAPSAYFNVMENVFVYSVPVEDKLYMIDLNNLEDLKEYDFSVDGLVELLN